MSLQSDDICEVRYDSSHWHGYQVKLIQYQRGKTWQTEVLKIPPWLLTFRTKYVLSFSMPFVGDKFIWDDVNALHPLKYESTTKPAKLNPEPYISLFDGKLK